MKGISKSSAIACGNSRSKYTQVTRNERIALPPQLHESPPSRWTSRRAWDARKSRMYGCINAGMMCWTQRETWRSLLACSRALRSSGDSTACPTEMMISDMKSDGSYAVRVISPGDVEREWVGRFSSSSLDAEDDREGLEDVDRLDWANVRPPGNARTMSLEDGRNKDRPRSLRRDRFAS